MKKIATSLAALLVLFCLNFAIGCQQQKGASSEQDYSEQQNARDQHASQQNQGAQLSGDQQFIAEAAIDGRFEVEAGRLAATKASNPAVKRFAQKLVEDHSKANQQLESLPQAGQVLQSLSMPEDKRNAVDQLSQLSGKEFDRAFIDQIVHEHEKAVARFQEVAASAQDAQVKQFAAQTLPGLQQHLQTAKSLQSRLSRDSAGGQRNQQ